MTFRIDANGLLNVHARDVRTGNNEGLTSTNERLNLPREEIGRLVEEGEFARERLSLMTRYEESARLDTERNGNLN